MFLANRPIQSFSSIVDQRKCRVIFGFDDSHLNEHIDKDSGSNAENIRNRPTVSVQIENFPLKDGIRLPKSDKDETIANDYFHALFTGTLIDSKNVDNVTEQLSTSIYDYFKTNFGSVKESIQCQLDMKYSIHSEREFKKDLKRLKDRYAPPREKNMFPIS